MVEWGQRSKEKVKPCVIPYRVILPQIPTSGVRHMYTDMACHQAVDDALPHWRIRLLWLSPWAGEANNLHRLSDK